jgi:hypothetical protein
VLWHSAYLLEVARCIAAELRCAGDENALGLELARAFSERVMGFEILTAPFAIAQLQLYLLLDELGSTPDEAHRVAVLLTNALSGWHDAGDIKLNFPEKGGIRCLAKGKARGEDHCHPWQSSL